MVHLPDKNFLLFQRYHQVVLAFDPHLAFFPYLPYQLVIGINKLINFILFPEQFSAVKFKFLEGFVGPPDPPLLQLRGQTDQLPGNGQLDKQEKGKQDKDNLKPLSGERTGQKPGAPFQKAGPVGCYGEGSQVYHPAVVSLYQRPAVCFRVVRRRGSYAVIGISVDGEAEALYIFPVDQCPGYKPDVLIGEQPYGMRQKGEPVLLNGGQGFFMHLFPVGYFLAEREH